MKVADLHPSNACCADRNLHGSKKWRVGRNSKFVVRQDVPEGNWALVPSPELQLEHEVRLFLLSS